MKQNIYGLGDYSTSQIKELAKLVEAEKLNSALISQRRPDAAQDPLSFIKQLSPEMAAYIIPDAFSGNLGSQLAAGLTNQQLEKIGADGEPYLKAAIKIALEEAQNKNPNDANIQKSVDYINQSPAWQ